MLSKTIFVDDDKIASEIGEKTKLLQQLGEQKKQIELEKRTVEKSTEWTNGWAENVKATPMKMAKDAANFLTADYLEKVRSFGNYFSTQLNEKGAALVKLENQLKGLNTLTSFSHVHNSLQK